MIVFARHKAAWFALGAFFSPFALVLFCYLMYLYARAFWEKMPQKAEKVPNFSERLVSLVQKETALDTKWQELSSILRGAFSIVTKENLASASMQEVVSSLDRSAKIPEDEKRLLKKEAMQINLTEFGNVASTQKDLVQSPENIKKVLKRYFIR